jgi:drug/metabolite transporter (DMT)-like permease
MGILLALSSAACFAIFSIIAKISVNKTKYPDAVTVIYQVIAGIASLLFIFQDGMKFQEVGIWNWVLLIVGAALYGYGNILSFRSNKVLDVSLSSIIGQLALLFAFFGSIFLFKESITLNKILGVVFIIAGNIFVLNGTKFSKLDTKMIIYKIIVCVMFAVANLLDGYNGKNFPSSFYIFFGYVLGGVIAYFGSKICFEKVKEQFKENSKALIIMGFTAALGYYFFLQAFNFADKSIVIPLAYLSSIITVLLGITILKETKSLWKKIISIIIVFLGSVLINL